MYWEREVTIDAWTLIAYGEKMS